MRLLPDTLHIRNCNSIWPHAWSATYQHQHRYAIFQIFRYITSSAKALIRSDWIPIILRQSRTCTQNDNRYCVLLYVWIWRALPYINILQLRVPNLYEQEIIWLLGQLGRDRHGQVSSSCQINLDWFKMMLRANDPGSTSGFKLCWWLLGRRILMI